MSSRSKKLRSLSLVSHLSSCTNENFLRFHTESLEQSIKSHVETTLLDQLLIQTKQLTDLINHDSRISKDYFHEIEQHRSHIQSNRLINDLIHLIQSFFDKYLFSSIVLRCYIQLHLPSNESGDNQGVNIQKQILKEIIEMETIIQSNEHLFGDYYKKHYEIVKYLNKYPTIEDFHLFLLEYERKIFHDLRSMIIELRTIFLKTYDIIQKNLTCIQMPRIEPILSMIN